MKIGLFSTLFLILLVLKLLAVITISWWWVFAPLMVIVGFWCFILPVVLITCACYGIIKGNRYDK